MVVSEEEETELQEKERDAVFRRCERFLGGHGKRRPHEVLAELANETSPDEDADSYGSGELIEEFERELTELLGKEAAVFLPSGTMAQQIALRIWSDKHGSRTVAFHPTCHLEIHEQKGYQLLHSLHARLTGDPRRLLTLEDLQNIHEPVSALLLELPQRPLGGMLPSWEDLQAQLAWARERGIATHLDGARLWEAGPFYARAYAEIAANFDSIYVSFYKGIGAIAGSALLGPADFITESRVWIRRHGGNLVRLYPYVISARTNLRRRLPKFQHYHERAEEVARILSEFPEIEVKPNPPHTNMMHVYIRADREKLLESSLQIACDDKVAILYGAGTTDIPGYCVFELSIGDGLEAFTDEEVRCYVERLLSAAR
jgi:threonine aldolase